MEPTQRPMLSNAKTKDEDPDDNLIWVDPDYNLMKYNTITKPPHWWVVKLPNNRSRYRPV